MYKKKETTIAQQVELLQSRGLAIVEADNAAHYLSHISYYRLGEYWHSMQSDKNTRI